MKKMDIKNNFPNKICICCSNCFLQKDLCICVCVYIFDTYKLVK